jgi:hypothetical protein
VRTHLGRAVVIRLGVVAIAVNLLVLPLFTQAEPLIVTNWGQSGDYARFSPGHWRLGCWSTAFAQILYYHRLTPTGSVSYHCSTGYSISADFDSYCFDWDLFVNSINAHTPQASIDEVAKYSYFAAVTVEKDFGTGDYVLGHYQRTSAIADHYNCETKLYSNLFYSMSQIKAAIVEQVDALCPLLMHLRDKEQDNYHAVVIDDYSTTGGQFRVHLNMGHEGADNGWYNFDSPILGYDDNSYRRIVTVTPIPEPSTLVLLALGAVAHLLRRRLVAR